MRHVLQKTLRFVRDSMVLSPGMILLVLGRVLRRPVIALPLWGLGFVDVRPADSDVETFRQVFVERQFDISSYPQDDRLRRAYERLLAEGKRPVIVDAGANVGASAHWFSRQYPESLVVAIEPDRETARLCRRNVAALGNVVVVEGAIGGEHGTVRIDHPDKSWATQTQRVEGGAGIPVYTIADLVELAGADGRLFVVKIDIEGFEADLFQGGTEWIANAAAVFIEPHDWLLPGKKTSQPMQAALLGKGFEILVRHENLIFVREASDASAALA